MNLIILRFKKKSFKQRRVERSGRLDKSFKTLREGLIERGRRI